MKEVVSAIKKLMVTSGEIAVARQNSGLIIEYKEDKSPVTNADKEISNLIYSKLSILTPDIPVICEEQLLRKVDTDRFWLVDPIDGTKSYIKGERTYTVNVALIENRIPKYGFIYQPAYAKLHYTNFLGSLMIEQNGNILNIDKSRVKLNQGYVAATGSRGISKSVQSFLDQHNITSIINMPSTMKFCLIAEGEVDIVPCFAQSGEWDTAAGHAIIRASGGEMVDISGEVLLYGKPEFKNNNFIAYSNKWIHNH